MNASEYKFATLPLGQFGYNVALVIRNSDSRMVGSILYAGSDLYINFTSTIPANTDIECTIVAPSHW